MSEQPVIRIVGATGGAGTTTTALVMAQQLGGSATARLSDARADMAAIAGTPPFRDGGNLQHLVFGDGPLVFDSKTLRSPVSRSMRFDATFVVVRGPSYNAALAITRWGIRADGIILLEEYGRALRATDLEAATGLSVVAVQPVSHDVARCIDAGLMSRRVHAAGTRVGRQFTDLTGLVARVTA